MAATSPSDGQGRGVAADVCGNPVVDRAAAGAACLGMTGFGSTGAVTMGKVRLDIGKNSAFPRDHVRASDLAR